MTKDKNIDKLCEIYNYKCIQRYDPDLELVGARVLTRWKPWHLPLVICLKKVLLRWQQKFSCAHWLIFDLISRQTREATSESGVWQFVKQIDARFSCVYPVIHHEFCHDVVKVVRGSTRLSPCGSTAYEEMRPAKLDVYPQPRTFLHIQRIKYYLSWRFVKGLK